MRPRQPEPERAPGGDLPPPGGALLTARLAGLRPAGRAARRGSAPRALDPRRRRDVVLLHSFLWPGLDERVERLDAAIETFRAAPSRPELLRGDYVDLLPGLLAQRSADVLTVVFQTASTGYLLPDRYDELRRSLEHAGADGRPLAWVSSRRREERETDAGDAWELELRIWPEPGRLVALVDFHGNWLDWLEA